MAIEIRPGETLQLRCQVTNNRIENIETIAGSGGGTLGSFIEGPWGVHQPVHEAVTLLTIQDVIDKYKSSSTARGALLEGVTVEVSGSTIARTSPTQHELKPEEIHSTSQQFIRGVIWPDDPDGLMFDDPKTTEDYSTGAEFGRHWFLDGTFTHRSHHGNLQFFHVMAAEAGFDPKETQKEVHDWAEFLVRVATAVLKMGTVLNSISPMYVNYFNTAQFNDYTLEDFFCPKKEKWGTWLPSELDVRRRAAGALLHLIQDSYSKSHVNRDDEGLIAIFYCYPGQDKNKHDKEDEWGDGTNLGERIERTSAQKIALEKGAAVLELVDQSESVSVIMNYLDNEVFKLGEAPQVSGPGPYHC